MTVEETLWNSNCNLHNNHNEQDRRTRVLTPYLLHL